MWNYLKFCEIHIQCTIKPQRSCNGGHNLTNQAIEISVRGTLDIKITTAYIVNGLVINHERAIRVFQGGVSGENRIVRLHHCCGNLGGGVDRKFQLGLLAVVNWETLH